MLKYLGRKGELAAGKIQAWAGARVAPGICQTAKAKEFHLCLVLCSLREKPVFSTDDQQHGEENQTPTTSQKIRYPGQFSLYSMDVPFPVQPASLRGDSQENWEPPSCQGSCRFCPGWGEWLQPLARGWDLVDTLCLTKDTGTCSARQGVAHHLETLWELVSSKVFQGDCLISLLTLH